MYYVLLCADSLAITPNPLAFILVLVFTYFSSLSSSEFVLSNYSGEGKIYRTEECLLYVFTYTRSSLFVHLIKCAAQFCTCLDYKGKIISNNIYYVGIYIF